MTKRVSATWKYINKKKPFKIIEMEQGQILNCSTIKDSVRNFLIYLLYFKAF